MAENLQLVSGSACRCGLALTLVGSAAGVQAVVGWQVVERVEDLQVGREVEGLEGVDWRAEGCMLSHHSDTESSLLYINMSSRWPGQGLGAWPPSLLTGIKGLRAFLGGFTQRNLWKPEDDACCLLLA